MSVRIIGCEALYKKLTRMGGDADAVVTTVNEQTVTIAAADARMRCPKGAPRGGEKGAVHLVSTISERRDADGKRVWVTCGSNSRDAHAAYVEFGTGQRGSASPSPPKWDGPLSYRYDWDGMAAQPFLFPASELQKEEYPKRMKDAMKKAIAKIAKG